jgi:peptide/nickel transport system permease protein
VLDYLLRRLASMALVLVASTVIVFGMLHLAPGDPAQILLAGRPVTEESLQAIRDKYALDQPVPVQYLAWLKNVSRGDFGDSIKGHDTVVNVVKPRILTTIELTVVAMLLILAVGIPVGILSAMHQRGGIDVVSSAGTLLASSIPPYVTGIALIAVFAVTLGWLPALGSGDGGVDTLKHLTLPAIALALSGIALVSRVTRIAMIEALDKEYVETARIRGFSTGRVTFKHALRSALIPVVTISGVLVGYLLSGAVLVEYTFSISGVGALLVSSVQGLDYAVVQALALLITLAFLVVNFVVDVLYVFIDPRVRVGLGARQ